MWKSCAKCILILISSLFLLFGFVLCGAGIALKVAQPYLHTILNDYKKSIHEGNVIEVSANNGGSAVELDLDPFINALSTALICVGIGIMIITILGLCGACCESSCMLIMYGIIVLVLLLTQATVLIVLFTGELNPLIKRKAHKMIAEEFGGVDALNYQSLLLNGIMILVGCCGVNGYTDFEGSQKWDRERTLSVRGQVALDVTLEIPIACCIMEGTFPSLTLWDSTCPLQPSDINSYWKQGCFNKTQQYIADHYQTPVIAGLSAFLFLELLLVIIAFAISANIRGLAKHVTHSKDTDVPAVTTKSA